MKQDQNSKKITSIKRMFDKGTLFIPREFQRNFIWKNNQSSNLIKVILEGSEIPKVYFRKHQNGTYSIIDGQQRITSICNYMDDAFSLNKNITVKKYPNYSFKNKLYSDLDEQFMEVFDDYEIDVVECECTDEEAKTLFLDLQAGSPLNSDEKRKGLISNMVGVVFDLSKNNLFNIKFFNGNNKRFQYERLSATALFHVIMNEVVGASQREIDQLYLDNKNISVDDNNVKEVKKVFNFLYKTFKDRELKLSNPDFIRIFYLTYRLIKDTNLGNDDLSKNDFYNACLDFINIQSEIKIKISDGISSKNFNDEELSMYDYISREKPTYQSKNQKYRHQILYDFVTKRLSNTKLLDPKRFFSLDDRIVSLKNQKYKCVNKHCLKDIDISTSDADHIFEHSLGGKSDIDNLQMLCKECHKEKTAEYNSKQKNFKPIKMIEKDKSRKNYFTFEGAGIKPNDILVFFNDGNITCRVLENNKVEFRGEIKSLSRAALTVWNEQGNDWPSIRGPRFWMYNGKLLTQLFEESNN